MRKGGGGGAGEVRGAKEIKSQTRTILETINKLYLIQSTFPTNDLV